MNEYERNATRDPKLGLCKFAWCPHHASEQDVRCDGHLLEGIKTVLSGLFGYGNCGYKMRQRFGPSKNVWQCSFWDCTERAVMDGLCGPCYNNRREQERIEQENRKARLEAYWTPERKKKSLAFQAELDEQDLQEMIDLEWWLESYGEEELPAKYMNREFRMIMTWDKEEAPTPSLVELSKLSKKMMMELNSRLKELSGTAVGGTHIWTFVGSKQFKREGVYNLFKCVPIEGTP